MMMGSYMQVTVGRKGGTRRTIVQLLRESMEMDGAGRLSRWKSLKERLGLVGIGCCGANWAFRSSSSVGDYSHGGDGPHEQSLDPLYVSQIPPEHNPGCAPVTPWMNLAAALAAERNFRAGPENTDTAARLNSSLSPNPTRPNSDDVVFRISLMRLLEETDDQDEKIEEGGGAGTDSVCCVCMVRKKGAAFIPCGHTFCRVCSRELWLNRGNCPLCNRSIVEILDIF